MLNFFLKLFGTPDTAEGKEPMLNLVLPMIGNMLAEIVKDKATDFVESNLEEHLDKLPKEAREALDGAINDDSSYSHKSLLDLVRG